jgi:hypothetical protein
VLVAMREVPVPMWCRKRISNPTRTKAEGRLSPSTRLLRLPTLKKKKNAGKCFLCGGSDHWARDCKNRKDKQQQGQKIS